VIRVFVNAVSQNKRRCNVEDEQGDIIATINLLPSDSGGRHSPTPEDKFHCLMIMEEKNYDVRIHLKGIGSISPGQTVRIPISFLCWDVAKHVCFAGKRFFLRELKLIGDGVIDEIISPL
jgi:hypothetical protein